jgi:hypothetical protein
VPGAPRVERHDRRNASRFPLRRFLIAIASRPSINDAHGKINLATISNRIINCNSISFYLLKRRLNRTQ